MFAVSVGVAKPVFWAPFLQRPPGKRKGGQVRFSSDQTQELERKFDVQKYMSPLERKRLAKSLQLTERQVSITSLQHQQCQQQRPQQRNARNLLCVTADRFSLVTSKYISARIASRQAVAQAY